MSLYTILGTALVLVGGAMEGSFVFPLKLTTKWDWENTWGAGSLLALLIIPWPVAFLSVPHMVDVYSATSWESLLISFAFGCGWGFGGIFLGLGISALGLSLGVSLISSLNAVAGSVVPLGMQHPDQLARPAGVVLAIGVAVMTVGITLCGWAGKMKEASSPMRNQGGRRTNISHFKTGILLCVVAAILCALVNFALIFGVEIRSEALRHGSGLVGANNALWAPAFTGNYLVNIAYCCYLLYRRRSYRNFFQPGVGGYWLWALFMGVSWAGGIVVYGLGVAYLGPLGAFLGFPMMLIASILAANALGVLSGEWTEASSKAKRVMAIGVGVLILAVCVLATKWLPPLHFYTL